MVDEVKKSLGSFVRRGISSARFYFLVIAILFSILFVPNSVTASKSTGTPVIDGTISHDEYDYNVHFDDDNYMIFWSINGSIISVGLKAKTTGWVALGIDPTSRMKNADMIFGWVDSDGTAHILDCYSTGSTGPHPPDTELGGTSDIIVYAGTESGGWTSIEFNRSLTTGDQYDKPFSEKGMLKILWAYGPSDDFTDKHAERGTGKLNLATGESEEVVFELWYIHAGPMIIGFILMASGNGIVLLMRGKSWWFKAHRYLGIGGGTFSFIGLLTGIFMVAETTGEHLRVPHTYLGLITITMISFTLASSSMILRNPGKASKFKRIHRWLGRIALTLMIITMFVGFSLI
jgi:hypothetical protein